MTLLKFNSLAKRCILIGIVLASGPACERTVLSGQTLKLSDQELVIASGGNAQQAPVPAVLVQPEAALVVVDAQLTGGGIVVERVDQQRYGKSGAGISVDSGAARVTAGRVQGGNILVNVPVDDF